MDKETFLASLAVLIKLAVEIDLGFLVRHEGQLRAEARTTTTALHRVKKKEMHFSFGIIWYSMRTYLALYLSSFSGKAGWCVSFD